MGEDCAERAGLVLPVRGHAVVGSGPDLLDMIDEGTKMTDYAMRVLDIVARADHHDSIWWRTDNQYAPITFFVNCSDVFSWGSADLEDLTPERLEAFEQALKDCTDTAGSNVYGPELFCARMRGCRPQGAAYPENERLWPLFDACGPERDTGLGNPYRPGQRKRRAEERSDDPSKASDLGEVS